MNLLDAIRGRDIYLNMKNNLIAANYFIFESNGVKSNSNSYIFLVKNGDIHSYEIIENEELCCKINI